EAGRVVPTHVDHGVVVGGHQRATGPERVPPVRSGELLPATGVRVEDQRPACNFGGGDMPGGFGELAELGVGDRLLVDPKPIELNRVWWAAVGGGKVAISHHNLAAGNPTHAAREFDRHRLE